MKYKDFLRMRGTVIVREFPPLSPKIPDKKALKILSRMKPLNESIQHNVITDAGIHKIIDDYFLDGSGNKFEYLAVGDDSTAASTSDTALGNEVFRKLVTYSWRDTKTFKTSTYIGTTEGNGYTFKEVGLFDASVNGTLLNHAIITSTTKDNTKTITIDIYIELSEV